MSLPPAFAFKVAPGIGTESLVIPEKEVKSKLTKKEQPFHKIIVCPNYAPSTTFTTSTRSNSGKDHQIGSNAKTVEWSLLPTTT